MGSPPYFYGIGSIAEALIDKFQARGSLSHGSASGDGWRFEGGEGQGE